MATFTCTWNGTIVSSSLMRLRSTILQRQQRQQAVVGICGFHSAWPQYHDKTPNSARIIPRRSYFTNTDQMKKDDPYALLGLQWGDASSTADIKQAFRQKARELHPDVNTTDKPEVALQKFQALQKAYTTLLGTADDAEEGVEQWRFAVWRQADRLAQDRTDVAGLARKRPVQPASKSDAWKARQLGHPDGRGSASNGGRNNNEYLGDGKTKFSSVGTGQSKWVQPKQFTPWNPEASQQIRASNFAKKKNTQDDAQPQ